MHNAKVYLGPDGKVITFPTRRVSCLDTKKLAHLTKNPPAGFSPFNGRFFEHPLFAPDNTAGLVTLTEEESPTARWVFVDAQTHECRWGGRQNSEVHVCVQYDWPRDEQRVSLQGWEGWPAVRDPDDEERDQEGRGLGVQEWQGIWRMCFDENDDGADLHPGVQA